MALDVKDVYQQAFEAHRHASDFRAKIIGGWAAVFTVFAGLFAWSQTNRPDKPWIIPLAGLVLNVMMWLADIRNRPAIEEAKRIGRAIESDTANGLKAEWHFFSKVERGVTHSQMIDAFGLLSSAMFIGAAWALAK